MSAWCRINGLALMTFSARFLTSVASDVWMYLFFPNIKYQDVLIVKEIMYFFPQLNAIFIDVGLFAFTL